MPATLSLVALYRWDSTILDGLMVPQNVDRETVINNLLRECAELELLYPQPEILKNFIKSWSKERFSVWDRLAKTLEFEYDPISNYDRKEEWSDNSTGKSESMTAGYNSADADVPDARSTAESSGKRTGRAYGNIGVTTTQTMIRQEREISEFDIDHVIINDFKKTFCLLIY